MKRMPPIIPVLIGLGTLWTGWILIAARLSLSPPHVHRTQAVGPRSTITVAEETIGAPPHRGTLTYGHFLLNSISQRVETPDPPAFLLSRSTFSLSLIVHNTGPTLWPAKKPIQPLRQDESRFEEAELGSSNMLIGHRWLDETGKTVESRNFLLPHDVPAGGTISLNYALLPPERPGLYRLIVRMIQSGGKEIDDKEEGPLKLSVRVGLPSRSSTISPTIQKKPPS